MNAIIFENEQAQVLISQQEGQHQLAPVKLSGGRWFLLDDVLDELLYKDKLVGVKYTIVPFDSIRHLLPIYESEDIYTLT
jgi:hypothetical protein